MDTYNIKQLISGTLLGTVKADDMGDALNEFAKEKGYNDWSGAVQDNPQWPMNLYAEKA